MKILVTGGAGFIGSNLSNFLFDNKFDVHVVDNLYTGKRKNLKPNIKFYKIDISKKLELNKLPKKIDIIFHLASQSSGEISYYKPDLDFKYNLISTSNIVNWGIKIKIKKFIFTSSVGVYKPSKKTLYEDSPIGPISNYGFNKYLSEKLIVQSLNQVKISYTIFRLFNVYGPNQDLKNLNQGILSIYLSYILRRKPIIIKGKLNRTRDLIYIDDVLKAFMLSIKESRLNNKIFNISSGKSTSIKNLIYLLLKISNNKKNYPIKIKDDTMFNINYIRGNSDKLSFLTGWKTNTTLAEGIKKMYDYYNAK